MVTKFLIVATALMAVAMASVIPAPAAVAYAPGQFVKTEEYDPVPQYTYAYDVQDTLTGDTKSQQETRNGDVVSGSYSFIEADGTRRLVEYTADPINGFNAVVHREPAVVRAVPVAPAAPIVAAPAPLHRYHH